MHEELSGGSQLFLAMIQTVGLPSPLWEPLSETGMKEYTSIWVRSQGVDTMSYLGSISSLSSMLNIIHIKEAFPKIQLCLTIHSPFTKTHHKMAWHGVPLEYHRGALWTKGNEEALDPGLGG
jgi:hypothetical protein